MMETTFDGISALGLLPLLLWAASLQCAGQDAAVADQPAIKAVKVPASECVDEIERKVVIDAELHSDFFDTSTKQYPWYIIVHPDGHLENVAGDEITAEDRVQIEHTASCVSTHQGEHKMKFCDATLDEDGKLTLHIFGGLPAYASKLDIEVDAEQNVKCSFWAVYPGPTGQLWWRIKKKEVRFPSADISAGFRLHGWISVEFEEGTIVDGEEKGARSHKIEGFIKPVVEKKGG